MTNPFKTSPRAVSIILVLALLADEWARRRKRTVCWPPDRSAPSGPPALFSSPRSALRPATNLAALTVTANAFPVPDQTWPCRLLASPTCLVTTARVIIAAFAGKPAGGLSSERPLSSGSERWAIPGGRRHDDAQRQTKPARPWIPLPNDNDSLGKNLQKAPLPKIKKKMPFQHHRLIHLCTHKKNPFMQLPLIFVKRPRHEIQPVLVLYSTILDY